MAHRAASPRKRILFLTPQLPYPPQQGTAIRNFNLIAQVAARHEVHLLSFVAAESVTRDLEPLERVCTTLETVAAPVRKRWQRLSSILTSPNPDMHHRLLSAPFYQALETTLAEVEPEVVEIEGLEMAQYGLAAHRLTAPEAPLLVFDAHNAEYLLQQRIFASDLRHPRRWLGAAYSWVQWRKLLRYEAAICRQADRVIACSPADAAALERLVPALRPTVVPNGVDTAQYRPGIVSPAPLGSSALVFTGKMDFRPNVDAVLWFCSHVLPTVRQLHPEAHFYIVGRDPHPRLMALAQMSGVTITGFVEDPRPYISAAAVYVAPLLTGGGTRLKVLEAMAMGKALVSTTLGCEGIPAASGSELILADGAPHFAAQVVALLGDRPRCDALGRAARSFVERHFDWHIVTAALEQVYEC